MAARKLSASTVSAAHVVVMFEEIRGQFRVFGEALHGVDRKVEEVKGDVALLKLAVLDNSREIRELRRCVDEELQDKVDRDDLHRALASRKR